MRSLAVDSREKNDFLRLLLNQLRGRDMALAFLALDEMPRLGPYDFLFVNRNPVTWVGIEKGLREQKYAFVEDFVEDMQRMITAVSDYIFEDDPFQAVCSQFLQVVQGIPQRFSDKFLGLKGESQRPVLRNEMEGKLRRDGELKEWKDQDKKEAKAKETAESKGREGRSAKEGREERLERKEQERRDRKATLQDKLEFLFLLKAHANNESYLRSVGSFYSIGKETDDHYQITLDNKNSSWLKFISSEG